MADGDRKSNTVTAFYMAVRMREDDVLSHLIRRRRIRRKCQAHICLIMTAYGNRFLRLYDVYIVFLHDVNIGRSGGVFL